MKAKNQPALPHQGRIGKFTSVASLVVALAVGLAAGVDAAAAAGEGAPEPISTTMDIPYFAVDATNDYVREQCKLDLYLPKNGGKPFPLIVWFHGGGLQGGSKTSGLTVKLAKSLAMKGVGVVVPEYRFSPKALFPAYVEDAALSVKWAVEHASELGAATNVFVGGHSAGGYLASLLAMDSRYFEAAGVVTNRIAGYIPMSGQTMTHFTVAMERGHANNVITADDAAPIRHLASATPPILLLVGDDDWPARLQENEYFAAALRQVAGNPNVRLVVAEGRDHGTILREASQDGDPAGSAMLEFLLSGVLPSP